MIYTPSVWQEWLTAAAIIAAGASCLRLGTWSGRRSARARNITAAVGIALALGGAAAHYPPVREVAGAWLSIPGGEGELAFFCSLTLLCVAGADHERRAGQ